MQEKYPRSEYARPVNQPEMTVPPAVIDTLRTSWTYCAATATQLASRTPQRLGLASALISTLTSTAIFLTWQSDPGLIPRLVVAVVMLIAALLAAGQTWYNRQRADLLKANRDLHDLHRCIEDHLWHWRQGDPDALSEEFGDEVRKRMDNVNISDIPTSGKIFREASDETRKKMEADFGLS